ncbi:MAG: hypothetical protein ACM339_08840, partial [Ignavibacteria bacterium]
RGDEGGLVVKNKAKMVYEFDAADIGKSYIYPLMAHSFKEAGMQWAAMFCYDPSAIAQYNSEYSTHYLNLLFTPQKALGFLIAAYLFNNEVVSEKKIDSSSVLMNNVLTDYDHDLSLLNTNERFYYSSSNSAAPKEIKELKHIAGYGSSKLIKYDGRGAYFLDKISDDLWKLELFPDAVWIKDPFGRNGLSDPIAKLIRKSHKIRISLPGLNSNYNIYALNNRLSAVDFSIDLEPGVYFITNNLNPKEKEFNSGITDFEKIRTYGEFIEDFNSTEIKNLTPASLYQNGFNKITVEIYSKENNPGVNIYLNKLGWRSYRKFEMKKINDFIYEFIIPEEISPNGIFNYFISVKKDKNVLTFPGKLNSSPEDWSFNSSGSYKLSVFADSGRKIIYDPERDINNLIFPNIWRFAEYRIDYTFDENNEDELNVQLTRIKEKYHELALQFYTGDYLKDSPAAGSQIEFEIMKEPGGPDSVLVRIIFNNSTGFERKIILKNNYEKIILPVSLPEKFKFALLPRPYPTFLPYWFESMPPDEAATGSLKIESIQLAIPLPEVGKELKDYGVKLKKITFLKNMVNSKN